MDKDGRVLIGEHIENIQAAEDLIDRSGGSTTGVPTALKILPPAYQGLAMFFLKSDHPDDQRIEIFNPSEPTDEERSRIASHVRNPIKAAYLLFSLPMAKINWWIDAALRHAQPSTIASTILYKK